MNHRHWISAVVFAAAACATTGVSLAQEKFPVRPVRLVVPFTPGGVLDVLGRSVGHKLGEMWGQPVVIENRSGAGGALGAATVAKATPDGYTLLITAAGFISGPALQPNLPYDPVKDFSGVASLGRNVIVLVVSPSLGVKTAGDLVTLARAQPGKIIAASLGAGSGAYLNVEKFRLAAGLKIIHVGYKGQPEALLEIVAGRAHFTVIGMAPAVPLIKDGKLMPLAVADTARSPLLPDVPAITETPLAWRRDGSQAVMAPAGTPRAVVAKISKDIARVLAMPDIKERFSAMAFTIDYVGPEQLDRATREDVAAVKKLARDIGLIAK
jgi:tripartite-type tricarboxylate transporter receptor subunit TctC